MSFHVERREPRFNCQVCGSFVRMPDEIEDGYGIEFTFDCPRCASVYGVVAATGRGVDLELAVEQTEYERSRRGQARSKPRREAIYADPVFGPIRRAEDRLHAAERDLAQAMAEAHVLANRSIREIADATRTYRKSRVHELVKTAGIRSPKTDGMANLEREFDDIPF